MTEPRANRSLFALCFAVVALTGCDNPLRSLEEIENANAPTENRLLWELVHVLNAQAKQQAKECHDYMTLVHEVCTCPGDKR